MTTPLLRPWVLRMALVGLPACGPSAATPTDATIDAAADSMQVPDTGEAGADADGASMNPPPATLGDFCSVQPCPAGWTDVDGFATRRCGAFAPGPPDFGWQTSMCGAYEVLFWGDPYQGYEYYFNPSDGTLVAIVHYSDTDGENVVAGPVDFAVPRPCTVLTPHQPCTTPHDS